MEIKLSQPIASSLMRASEMFFKGRNFAATQDTFFKLFHCWAVSNCHKQTDLSHEEFGLFCDELIGLVSATYLVYQANKGETPDGGSSHA